LSASRGNQVVCITQRADVNLPGVKKLVYKPKRAPSPHTHHYIRDTEAGVLNAQEVARAALAIAAAVVDGLANPGDYRALRQRARRTVIDGFDLRSLALPAQLRLLREVTEPAGPYLWKRRDK
jgi:Glycosyl transferase family 4 group